MESGFNNISFDLPKNQSNVIKVIGVGGGGSNAINYMYKQGINGVDFVVCNTDAQALENSSVPNKIQLGVSLTEGLGAGANPEVGEQSALESFDDINSMLSVNTKMVFITAGMGGGTGTGAAPVIAKMAQDMDILTVGIVTIPFQFEGKMRNEQAQEGLEKLRKHVDSLIVINNNKLREVYGDLGFKQGFAKADEVLANASRGIAEVITHHYTQNIDLRDAKTVLSNSGTAIMGSAHASGSNRAVVAIAQAIDSPLLNDNKIFGAKNVLLLIVSGVVEVTLDEIGSINEHIQQEAGHSANIIMGVGEDMALEDAISVTVIATGFDAKQQQEIVHADPKKIIHSLGDEQPVVHSLKAGQIPLFEEPTKSLSNPSKDLHDCDVNFEIVAVDQQKFKIHEIPDAIYNIDVVDAEVVQPNKEQKTPFDHPLTTSAPSKPKQDKVLFHLDDQAEIETEVKRNETPPEDHSEIKRYSLEDYMQEDQPAAETKTKDNVLEEEINPINSTISQGLAKRSEERRKKLKEFNYKFYHSSRVEDLEREPAFKRSGVDLNEGIEDQNKASRTSVGNDDKDNLRLRTNNSFLHDNVD